MTNNGIIILCIIPSLIIIPILFRRRIKVVFSKNWPWVILGIFVFAYLLFVRDIPNTREGMRIVKQPELHFDEHLHWKTFDPKIGITWHELYIGKGHIADHYNFQKTDFNDFFQKLEQAYSARGLIITKAEVIKGIVQIGQNKMVTNIVPADLCPFTMHLLAIAMMFKWFRKKLASSIATWAILGGLLTSISSSFDVYVMNAPIMEILFISFIGSHLLQIWFGVMVLIIVPKITWREYIKSVIFIFIMVTYISIVYWMTNITMQTTGVAEGDWRPGGEFSILPQIFNITNKSIHLIRFSGWMTFIMLDLVVMSIALYSQKLDRKYISKFSEGFVYKRYGYIVIAFQKWFGNYIKKPIVNFTKRFGHKISYYWNNFWKVEDNIKE